MPAEKKAPLRPRTIRVEDALWVAATEKAEANHESVSDVLRRALRRYVRSKNS